MSLNARHHSPAANMEDLSTARYADYPAPTKYSVPTQYEPPNNNIHSTELQSLKKHTENPSSDLHIEHTTTTKQTNMENEFPDKHKKHPSSAPPPYEEPKHATQTPADDYALDVDSILNLYSSKNLRSPLHGIR